MPQTLYELKNTEKYLGNPSEILYRSSWEKAFMMFLEESPVIKKFNSEDFVVRYFYLLDKKWHRYYIDFYVELITNDKYLIEIKPFAERIKPNRYNEKAINTFLKNQCKWEAANIIAKEHGMTFLVLDEFDLKSMGVNISINPPSQLVKSRKILYEATSEYGQSVEKLSKPLRK